MSYLFSNNKGLPQKIEVHLKKFTLLIVLIGLFQSLSAQQRPHFSMYMLNKHKVNPAYAGFDESLSATAVYRQQWSGLVGAPEQINLNVHLPMFIIGGGIGLNIDSENAGVTSNTRAELSYSYWLNVSKQFELAIGARAGLDQMKINGNELRAVDGIYDATGVNHQDPILPEGVVNSSIPVFGLGAHFKSGNLEGGIAVENLTSSRIVFEFSNQELSIRNTRHFMAYAEYGFEFGTYFKAKPSFMLRSDIIQTELNLGILVNYDERFFGGGAYRGFNANTSDAFAIIIGASLNENISLSYAYDLTLSNLASVSSGSHEIMLNYNLRKPIGKGKLPNIIYNPRF